MVILSRHDIAVQCVEHYFSINIMSLYMQHSEIFRQVFRCFPLVLCIHRVTQTLFPSGSNGDRQHARMARTLIDDIYFCANYCQLFASLSLLLIIGIKADLQSEFAWLCFFTNFFLLCFYAASLYSDATSTLSGGSKQKSAYRTHHIAVSVSYAVDTYLSKARIFANQEHEEWQLALQLVISFLALSLWSLSPKKKNKYCKTATLKEASLLSKVRISWITRYTRISEPMLCLTQLPELPEEQDTAKAANEFHRAHDMHSLSIARTLSSLYGSQILKFALWSAMNKALGFCAPILMKMYLDWADTCLQEQGELCLSTGYLITALMVLRSVAAAVSGTQYTFAWQRLELRIRAALSTAIYRKMLSVEHSDIGHITSLISIDLDRVVGIPGSIFDLLLIPIEIAFVLWLLSCQVSYAFIIGLVLLCVMFFIQTLLGYKIQAITKQFLMYRDQRLEHISRLLESIKVFKLLAYMHVFQAEMDDIRASEMKQLKARKYIDAICVFFWASTPVLVQMSVFVMAVLHGTTLTAAGAFTAIALLDRLIFPLNYFPWIITGILEARVSFLRIESFLCSNIETDSLEGDGIYQYPDMKLQPGTLYIVCGAVGSGKSSRLRALLRQRELSMRSRISYAPQDAWIFPGTIRENIVCGNCEWNENLYQRTLTTCDLRRDLQILVNGDQTQVGTGGMSLSGGQRLRVSLARVLYFQSSVYLLDDPFSALDEDTALTIARNCFCSAKSIVPADASIFLVTQSKRIMDQIIDSSSFSIRVLVMEDMQETVFDSFLEMKQMRNDLFVRLCLPEKNIESCHSKNHKMAEMQRESKDLVIEAVSSVKEEDCEMGSVSRTVWLQYLKSMGTTIVLLIAISVSIMQLSRNAMDYWIAYYISAQKKVSPLTFAYGMVVIALINSISVLLRSFLFAYGGLQAAKRTYARLSVRIFEAPLYFFANEPLGRILNRLNGDTYAIDEVIPFSGNILVRDAAEFIGALIVLCYGNKWLLLVLVPLIVMYYRLQKRYRPISRHLKRLSANCQSPLLGITESTLGGLSVIKGLLMQKKYVEHYIKLLRSSQKVSFLASGAAAWFSVRLDVLGIYMTTSVALFAVLELQITGHVDANILGLTLTYALPIVGRLNAILNSLIDTERNIISLERIQQYSSIPSESEYLCSNEAESLPRQSILTETFPSHGSINVSNLTIIYKNFSQAPDNHIVSSQKKTQTHALFHISCDILAKSKVAIFGRTGSGKSTFITAFLKATPWETGKILVDNLDISLLPIEILRKKFTYIPQEITLFKGTIRLNLDRGKEYSDHALWQVLRQCRLYEKVNSLRNGLSALMDPKGFSQGERQLFCIARALLRKGKIVLMDEVTAALDAEMEKTVMKVKRINFDAERDVT